MSVFCNECKTHLSASKDGECTICGSSSNQEHVSTVINGSITLTSEEEEVFELNFWKNVSPITYLCLYLFFFFILGLLVVPRMKVVAGIVVSI